MSTQAVPFVTPEEYLEFDQNSDFRNEYVFGEIVPILDVTPEHALIMGNTIGAFHTRLSGSACQVFAGGPRVCLDPRALYASPDVTVICGGIEYTDDTREKWSRIRSSSPKCFRPRPAITISGGRDRHTLTFPLSRSCCSSNRTGSRSSTAGASRMVLWTVAKVNGPEAVLKARIGRMRDPGRGDLLGCGLDPYEPA